MVQAMVQKISIVKAAATSDMPQEPYQNPYQDKNVSVWVVSAVCF